jgi:hypothetical protein
MHYNKISFVETIKSKIRDAALNDFDSLQKDIIFMMDNLTVITPSSKIPTSSKNSNSAQYLYL